MTSQTMTYDNLATLKSNTFTRSDYSFGGWNGIIYTSNEEKTSSVNEFVQYVDLAPYFNKYGTNQKYHLELDLKPAKIVDGADNWINIYFQNGSTSKYHFRTINGENISSKNIIFTSNDFVHVSFDFEVFLSNTQDTYAMLAFYGGYGSGRVPIVKNVRVSLVSELSDGQVVSNLTTNGDITLYAKWKKLLYSNNAEINPDNDSYSSANEFMQYADFAPYIDTYGVDKVYNLEFDIKSENISNYNLMYVYFQNGNGAKYSFSKNVEVTTEYQHVSFDFIPYRTTYNQAEAILAFYGQYGTLNRPWVKNVRFSVYQ